MYFTLLVKIKVDYKLVLPQLKEILKRERKVEPH